MDPSSWVGKDGTRYWLDDWKHNKWKVPASRPIPGVRNSRPSSNFAVVVVKPAITSQELDAIPDELIAELGRFGDDIRREDVIYGTEYMQSEGEQIFYAVYRKDGLRQRYERILPDRRWFTHAQMEKAQRFYGADALWHFRYRK